MKKTMKIVAITIAMLGLMVLENKAIAQDVSINFRIGNVGVHYQNYNNGYYNNYPGYTNQVVYQQPYRDNYSNNYGYQTYNGYYDNDRRDGDNRDHYGYNRDGYSYNNRFENWKHRDHDRRNW